MVCGVLLVVMYILATGSKRKKNDKFGSSTAVMKKTSYLIARATDNTSKNHRDKHLQNSSLVMNQHINTIVTFQETTMYVESTSRPRIIDLYITIAMYRIPPSWQQASDILKKENQTFFDEHLRK